MEVGIAEAKDRLSELIGRAEQGEAVTITRHGRAVATLSATLRKLDRVELDRLMADVDADRAKLPSITTEDVIGAIKADHRW